MSLQVSIMIGQTISHYKILEKLGEGGMGVVYRATDTRLERSVALKFLPSELTASEEERARFVREAKAVSSLDHPNICTVYEADTTAEGQMFIAMAYYEGSSLNRIIEKGRVNLDDALRIAVQVAEGLQAAHEKEIVHRDVKPGNIVVTSNGQVKLVDFGLASQRGRTKLTRTYSTIGTAAYMAPEQATGKGADHRSDLWSLGVVLYEMLAGRLPFRGEHEAAMLYSIVNEEPQAIEEQVKETSPELVHILRRALEKDPSERYQSSADMLIDLRRLRKDTSRTGFPFVSSGRWRAAGKWRIPLIGIIASVLISGGIYLFYPKGLPIQTSSPETVKVRNLVPPNISNIQFSHLTVNDGLSQGSVICIFQDRQGFMWFGTQDGLNRYDGYSFRVFKRDPADSTTLNDSFIVLIAEDTAGTLWVGTREHPDMLNRFDAAAESFTSVARKSVTMKGWRISAARSEYIDSYGYRWYGTRSGGLNRVDTRSGQRKVYKHDPARPRSILSDEVFSVVPDPSGALWVGTREGLERFDPKTETFEHFRHNDRDPNSLSDNFVWPLLLDRTGVLWVGTYRGGLNRFDRNSETWTRYQHDDSDPRSLAGDRIYSLYQDRSGMIWIGTTDHGVDRFHPELASFAHKRHDPSNPKSLGDNYILSMAVSRAGSVWVGTSGGLDRWDRDRNIFTHFRHDGSNPTSIAEDQVHALLEDKDGVLWVGTVSHGLDRFDTRTGRFSHFTNDPSNPKSISGNRIYSLCEDRSGNLWIGTYGSGLNRFDRKTRTFKVYQHSDSVASSLGGSGVWAILEDYAGVLWVGTPNGGLNRFDDDSETFTRFPHDPENDRSLSDNMVLCLFEDRTGTLWVGTAAGLNRFNRESGTFQRYYEKDGIINNVVFGILEDGSGNLWISTNKGVSRLAPDRKTFRNYDGKDGLQGNEFNQGAYTKDTRSGEMFFGGPNGFNVFHPDYIGNNPYVPPVVFTSLARLDIEGNQIEEKGVSAKTEITLSYKERVVSFEVAALTFLQNNKHRFAYKLEGLHDNWIQLGTRRGGTIIMPDDGQYLFRVKGSNEDGVWNEEGASIRIIVIPPWWKSQWAYASYVIVIAGFLFVGWRKWLR